MLRDIVFPENYAYRNGSENDTKQFYIDALSHSTEICLLLGYFSSSAINVLSLGFANFIYKGGKMRAIINNVLSEEDKKAMANIYNLMKPGGWGIMQVPINGKNTAYR